MSAAMTARMARFAAALAFFHPQLDVLNFPAWDCLPYDRVSPNADIVSRRIDVLTRLAAGSEKRPFVLLTTVNAIVQRVPPRRLFDGRVLKLGPGGRIPLDRLQGFFRNNGYIRTDTVREPGEYAVRGGIVDLWPSGAQQPIRLDFFGDTLESLRGFDPLTQRSTGADRRFRPAPGQRGPARRCRDPALPVALPRGVRRGRDRRPALRIDQRGAAARRHGALAAVLLRDARNAVRLRPRRVGLARPPGRGGARPPARTRSPISTPPARRSAQLLAAPRRLYRPVKPDRMFLGEADWTKALAGRAAGAVVAVCDAGGRPPPRPSPACGGGRREPESAILPLPRKRGRVGVGV